MTKEKRREAQPRFGNESKIFQDLRYYIDVVWRVTAKIYISLSPNLSVYLL